MGNICFLNKGGARVGEAGGIQVKKKLLPKLYFLGTSLQSKGTEIV